MDDVVLLAVGVVGVALGLLALLMVYFYIIRNILPSLRYNLKTTNEKLDKIDAILRQKTDFTIDELFESIKTSTVIRQRIAEGLEENTYTIEGGEQIFQKALSMLRDAKKSILSIWCLPSEEPPEWYTETVEEKIKEGVQIIRLMNLRIPAIRTNAIELMKKYEHVNNFAVYHTDQTSSETMIVDDRQAIITFPTAEQISDINSAVYTDNPKFVNAIRAWYQQYIYTEKNRIKSVNDIMKYSDQTSKTA
jgi:sugar-specific transcriptional regulator TrmB